MPAVLPACVYIHVEANDQPQIRFSVSTFVGDSLSLELFTELTNLADQQAPRTLLSPPALQGFQGHAALLQFDRMLGLSVSTLMLLWQALYQPSHPFSS